MALCKQFDALTVTERIEFIGKITHLVMNDEVSFSRAQGMILKGEVQGLFDGVKILPKNENNDLSDNNIHPVCSHMLDRTVGRNADGERGSIISII